MVAMSILVNIELGSHVEDKSRILFTPCEKSFIVLKGERRYVGMKRVVGILVERFCCPFPLSIALRAVLIKVFLSQEERRRAPILHKNEEIY